MQAGLVVTDALEVEGVARSELTDLPQFRLHDGGGADESAKTWPVGPQDHWHVASEVDGADSIGIVVNV